MDSSSGSLYEKIGGHEIVAAIVDDFYRRVLADPGVHHHFAHLDMDEQRAHQTAFIGEVLGGPERYSGRSMVEAHAGLGLRKTDFDAVAGHLVASLQAFGVAQVHIDDVMSRIAGLEREILYRNP